MRPKLHPAALAAALLTVLAASAAIAPGLGPRAWGLRASAASDPDQALAGVHVDFGELVPNLRLQPSLEAGFGDADTLQLLVPVHWRFATAGQVTPYAGGGVLLAWIDHDDPPFGRDGDDDFDVAPVAVGGLDVPVDSRYDLLVELQLGAAMPSTPRW